MQYNTITIPSDGEKITVQDTILTIPNNPIIPFIEGDGIGVDITPAMQFVINAAVKKAYHNKRTIHWMEIYAGDKAYKKYGTYMPDDTIAAIKEFVIAIKGPLTTPIGGGFRSLNVHLRKVLDLYACVRPITYIPNLPSPVKHPEKVNMVIYRENTEDVYSGIEWESNSPEAKKIIEFIKKEFGDSIHPESGIGIKPISPFGTKRLVAAAIRHAHEHNYPSVTLVHKGNIMKYTEGAFKQWGYECAQEQFSDITITEDELINTYNGVQPEGKIVIKDRIADNMLQQILTRPENYAVLALPNLNGDYISDALAAQIGGLGLAPGANIGTSTALFEATHGTAPKHAGKDTINPSSLILSAVMMLEYMHWNEAAQLIQKGIQDTIAARQVTYDLAQHMNVDPIACSAYARAIVEHF